MSDSDSVGDASENSEKASIPGFGPDDRDGVPATAPTQSMRNVFFVLGGVVLVAIVVLLVVVLLFLTVIRDAVDDVEGTRNETAITSQQYESVKVGMREQDLRDELGEPYNETTSDGRRETTCLYYNEKDAGLVAGDRYKFCFINGRLNRKSRD